MAASCGVSEDGLARHVADAFRLAVADLAAVQPSALKLIPEKLVRQFQVVPLRDAQNLLTIATSDPTDVAAEQARNRGVATVDERQHATIERGVETARVEVEIVQSRLRQLGVV